MTKAAAAFDIASIKPSERTIEIVHPGTNEPLGVRLRLVSIDDDRLKRLKRTISDRRIYLEARGKTFKSDEIEENKTNLYFTATSGWEWYEQPELKDAKGNIVTPYRPCPVFNGEVPDFNRANFTAVQTELPWFGEQIAAEIGETKSFFGNSKPI